MPDFYFTVEGGQTHGPYSSSEAAREAAKPFAEEGLHCTIHRTDPVCDFCSDPHEQITNRYHVPDFGLAGMATNPKDDVGWASKGDWAACEKCHRLIEAGDRDGLSRRSLESFFKLHPEVPNTPRYRNEMANAIGLLHVTVFELIEGVEKH